MFPTTLQTPRLDFQRLCRDTVSVEEYYSLVGQVNPTAEAEMQYIPREPVASMGAAADRLADFEARWDARDRAEYALFSRETGRLVGTAGLLCRWEQSVALPAVRLRKAVWGRGYAGERADALLELAFDRLDFDCVSIPVHADNEQSRRAVARYVDRHGGRYEGCFRHDAAREDGPVDRHQFSITSDEYEDAK